MHLLREEIADLGQKLTKATDDLKVRLDANIENASKEIAANVDRIGARFDGNIQTASSEMAANIERIGDRFDSSVGRAEEGLKSAISVASEEFEKNVRIISEELHLQRELADEKAKALIDYAMKQLDATIEKRVAAIHAQTSSLIDEKVAGLRKSLSEAAQEQKEAFVRNASIAVGSALLVAVASVISKKISNSPIDALTVFRIVLGMLTIGGAASLAFRIFRRYRSRSSVEKDVIKLVIHDVGIIHPRGVGFHVGVLILAGGIWLLLTLQPTLFGFS